MDENQLRQKSLDAIDAVNWIPVWGRERIYGMIENRPDWCVSRQRAWGVPITVFTCKECEATVINPEMVDHIYDLFEKEGADVWFEKEIDELVPPGTVCQKCGSGNLNKETDILDVWFDSGVSHAAVLEARPELQWPADLYLEGSDQHRGWFHSSLLTAVGTRGKAPYKAVLTHGFVVDAQGKKMSKSIGNVIAPKAVINKYGAEVLRLWVAAADYRDDIRISDNILKQLSDAYRRIRNTCRFLIGNLSDFDPQTHQVPYEELTELDRYALYKLTELIAKGRRAYEQYEFHVVYHGLHNFCAVDLSAFYLDILKDRLYTSPQQSLQRRSAQTAIYNILVSMVRLMAPIMAFTSEEVWKFVPGSQKMAASVHMTELPEVDPLWNDKDLAAKWQEIMAIRAEVTKALERARENKQIGHALDADVVLSLPQSLRDKLALDQMDLRSLLIVSKVSLTDQVLKGDVYVSDTVTDMSIGVQAATALKCERCWVHDETVGTKAQTPTICERCYDALSVQNAELDK